MVIYINDFGFNFKCEWEFGRVVDFDEGFYVKRDRVIV